MPIATGNMNDSLLALVNGQFVTLRVPYPIGFFTKWVEGRIDDANAGWKGRALWTTYSTEPCSTSKAARRTGRRS